MKVTVAICTWNRSALLRKTLEQVTRLAIPSGVEWELLVINNNSTDDTEKIIETFVSRLPLRSVLESEPGLSNARNRAVREATGTYVLWTDDDVLVDEQWLAAYCNAFARRPDAAIFGGNIEPWFAGTPPNWLLRVWPRVASAYASRDLGNEEVPLSKAVLPFGANFAVRLAEQRRFLYDPNLGVRPDNIMGGEETTVILNMLAAGISGWWVPEARVKHYIPQSRQTLGYLRNYFKGYGEYCAQQEDSSAEARLFGAPRWLWRKAVASETKYRLHRYTARPETWIEDLIASSQSWGQLGGSRAKLRGTGIKSHGEHAKNELT